MSDGKITVQEGEDVTLTFTPTDEKTGLAGVTVNGQAVSDFQAGSASYTHTFEDVKADQTISVTFSNLGYVVETDKDGRPTYKVHDDTGLDAWAEAVRTDLSINCTLTDHITIARLTTGSNWEQVGRYGSDEYTGTFDGGGYTITGMDVSDNNAAMFYEIGSDGVVKNLTLQCVEFDGDNGAGGIAAENYGTIIDCKVMGTLTAGNENQANIGGIVVENSGSITGCHFRGKIIANAVIQDIGGIAAHNSGTIEGCCCKWTDNDGKEHTSQTPHDGY